MLPFNILASDLLKSKIIFSIYINLLNRYVPDEFWSTVTTIKPNTKMFKANKVYELLSCKTITVNKFCIMFTLIRNDYCNPIYYDYFVKGILF